MAQLDGKIALITGGTTGIGAATAKLFRDEGATVIVTGTDRTNLDNIAAELSIEAIESDVANVRSIAKAMENIKERHGRIDVLFANAGIPGAAEPLEAVSEESFDHVLNINLRGMFFTVQHAVPLMPDGSTIVLTASIGAYSAMPLNFAYSASKAGVRSLGRSLAASLLPRGIRVNVLTPGPFLTPLFNKLSVPAETVLEMMKQGVPMGRVGDPVEAAAVALFLAVPASSFVTGAEYKVSGGAGDL